MLPRRFPVILAFPFLILAAAFLLAACPEEEVEVAAIPELADGVLHVGSDIAYAPFEFFIEGTEIPDGLDIDIAKAIAEELGVEVEFSNILFDGLIPALQTAEFDIIMSAMTIRPDREELIDFVPYLNVGTGILVPAGNPKNIQGLDDLCGLTVAVQVGTIQEQFLADANQNTCAANKVNIVVFDTNPLAVEDVLTGGADANFSDFPVASLDAEMSAGALEVVETQIAPEPYGIGVNKGSTALKQAIADAVQAIRDSGKYDEILAKWELEPTALP